MSTSCASPKGQSIKVEVPVHFVNQDAVARASSAAARSTSCAHGRASRSRPTRSRTRSRPSSPASTSATRSTSRPSRCRRARSRPSPRELHPRHHRAAVRHEGRGARPRPPRPRQPAAGRRRACEGLTAPADRSPQRPAASAPTARPERFLMRHADPRCASSSVSAIPGRAMPATGTISASWRSTRSRARTARRPVAPALPRRGGRGDDRRRAGAAPEAADLHERVRPRGRRGAALLQDPALRRRRSSTTSSTCRRPSCG